MAPVFGLTTELVVGSAPPERAGAASGISQTGAELGGALGIAILGSIGVAVYRGSLGDWLTTAVPADVLAAARDTLGGAVAVSAELPYATGTALLAAARDAFVAGMHVTALIAAIVATGMALIALFVLRSHDMPASSEDEVPSITSPAEQAAPIAASQFERAD